MPRGVSIIFFDLLDETFLRASTIGWHFITRPAPPPIGLDIFATADELAELYGKSKDAVHGVIKRKMLQKPKRNITLYNFNAFAKIVPSSWRKKH